MAITVKVNVEGLARLRKEVAQNPALGRDIAAAWSTIYRAFVRQRFLKFSRGGGDWAALKPATIKHRRGKGEGAAILRDTGALMASLQPSLGTGGLIQQTARPLGFTAFLGGGGAYKSGPTLVQVATWQHNGEGRLPPREILVQPDASTLATMSRKAKEIMVKMLGNR